MPICDGMSAFENIQKWFTVLQEKKEEAGSSDKECTDGKLEKDKDSGVESRHSEDDHDAVSRKDSNVSNVSATSDISDSSSLETLSRKTSQVSNLSEGGEERDLTILTSTPKSEDDVLSSPDV